MMTEWRRRARESERALKVRGAKETETCREEAGVMKHDTVFTRIVEFKYG